MNKYLHGMTIVLGLLVQQSASAALPAYALKVLSPPGSSGVFRDINNAGVIAGYAGGEAVLQYPDGSSTVLPRLNGELPTINALGNNHSVSLAYHDPGVPDRVLQGALWHNGTIEFLPSLRTIPDGNGYSVIYSLSSDGRMAGASAVDGGIYDDYGNFFPYTHAVTYANGQLQHLGTLGGNTSIAHAINNQGDVVGVSSESTGWQSFIYRNGTMQALHPGADRVAFDINDAGQVIANSGSSLHNAVLWENGQITEFSQAGFGFSTVAALNNRGDVIGRMRRDGAFRDEGFIYTDGELMLLTSLVVDAGWDIHEVWDINDDGVIIAQGCRGADCTYVQLTPVPEPSAGALLAAGLAVTALAARRSRARRAADA